MCAPEAARTGGIARHSNDLGAPRARTKVIRTDNPAFGEAFRLAGEYKGEPMLALSLAVFGCCSIPPFAIIGE